MQTTQFADNQFFPAECPFNIGKYGVIMIRSDPVTLCPSCLLQSCRCCGQLLWHESNCHVITLVNRDWLIFLKKRCNLGQSHVYPVVLDTVVFQRPLPFKDLWFFKDFEFCVKKNETL